MFLDTSGLLCYFDEGDDRHEDASVLMGSADLLITHNYVLAEFIPLCHTRRLNRKRSLAFASRLMDNPGVEIIWVDRSLHQTALAFLRARPDKTYSLCDAVSFILMRRRGIIEALSTDVHFAQEGFVRLLNP
ncbi:MAG: type II toxin-antitoxin system VapC family toxin [Planctomycetes bacterium]|nr:type II toxin-antitoxin system VapC family toxin [Planctomycetota bacterium]